MRGGDDRWRGGEEKGGEEGAGEERRRGGVEKRRGGEGGRPVGHGVVEDDGEGAESSGHLVDLVEELAETLLGGKLGGVAEDEGVLGELIADGEEQALDRGETRGDEVVVEGEMRG